MTNTYAINTTRGQEFRVEQELQEMGVKPWVPRQLLVKHVKERKAPVWYDRPYVPKLLFAVFPAVYFRDVCELKHVIGKPHPLSEKDISGQPAYTVEATGTYSPAIPGLRTFKDAVQAEYADMERRRANAEWVCAYKAGDALRVLSGAFQHFPATFKGTIKRAEDEFARLRVEVQIFGRSTPVEVAPDMVERA